LNANGIIIGVVIGLVAGGSGLYLAFSEELLSIDILPPVKKLQDQIESKQKEVNSLKSENDKMMKFAAQVQEENKKTKSELDKVNEAKDRIYQQSQDLLAEKKTLSKSLSEAKQKAADYKSQAASLEKTLEDYSNEVKNWQQNVEESIKAEACQPTNQIIDQKIYWKFCDSKGNPYTWQMPVESYENLVKAPKPDNYFYFKLPDDEVVTVRDHTQFVGKSFENVIDVVYDNAGNDDQFIFEVWNIVAQLDTYSFDIGDDPRWALETLSRGGGDCEDTAILIADMIKSSTHTGSWQVKLVYFDSNNPSNPEEVNHVAVTINTGPNYYVIESTGKTPEAAYSWAGKSIFGWYYEV